MNSIDAADGSLPPRSLNVTPVEAVGVFHLLVLGLIVAVFLSLAALWDRATPPFNNPDEPAHWNYVRHVADTFTLPVLRKGDAPAQLLNHLVSAHFPPGQSIAAIRYESHQPPLYYATAAVLYKLTEGLPLKRHVEVVRLLSTLFGAGTILLSWLIVRMLAPREPWLALATAAFVAFVPMHINMSAAVDNDTLSDLLLTLTVVLLLRWVQRGVGWGGAITIGLIMGLAGLTKVSTLVALPLALLAGVLRWGKVGPSRQELHPLGALIAAYAVMLLVWGWWVLRNLIVYGLHDPLALVINRIVVSQPLTGPITLAAAHRFGSITFHSFWAQFGWMGIPVPQVYPPLEILTVLAFFGTLVACTRVLRDGSNEWSLTRRMGEVLLVLAWPVLVLASVVQYNLTFIQAQGRYLFPAIGGFGLFFMLGLSRLASPRFSTLVLAVASLLLALLSVIMLHSVVIPAWR
ncbi:MAG: glycosyltransferase family 39 protein [Chloroflexi bacterium]|nr:glycosyltransferase family 39 protein [Chloroflexota bacterium]